MTLFTGEARIGRPYWWEDVQPADLRGAPPNRVDVLIIGAGYTGLSAAFAAHDKGAKVAVIDAGKPGKGASTRNGGMVGAHPRLSWEKLSETFGIDTADAIWAETDPALDWCKNLIQRENIDCTFETTGRIQFAYTSAQAASQQSLAENIRAKSSAQCEVLSKDDLREEIQTDLYHGALLFPGHAALHPAKYHRGLLDAALRRGVMVVSNCPASGISREGARYRITTPSASILADKVVLATNGYTPRLFRWLTARVFPLPSFLIATEPLPSELIQELAPGRRMMVETRARHSYFRISPDGTRILFGGRASMVNIDLRVAAQRLHQTMCEIWPQLRNVKLSHAWTGNTGFSFSHMPTVGEHDGIHYACGFSGSGTVMAPYLGAKAALQALGDPDGETAYSETRLSPRWYHLTSRPWFLYPADLWFRTWVDWKERHEA